MKESHKSGHRIKYFVRIALFMAALFAGLVVLSPVGEQAAPSVQSDEKIMTLFKNHMSDIQVTGKGNVSKILADDDEGDRHQRFILKLSSGHTLLIVHNIDLSPRIDALEEGDYVEFNGEYEWNAQGGLVHWTHDDPHGPHENGWLKHEGRTYQ